MLNVECPELYYSKKIVNIDEAAVLSSELRGLGKKIGLCHGCFDVLQPGHVKHLESAKKLCDYLFVSLTADRFISSRKGEERPIMPEQVRAYMVANLEIVNNVIIAYYPTAIEIIEKLKPSFYIKGPDIKRLQEKAFSIKEEQEAVKRAGGELVYTEDPELHLTDIVSYIQKMRKID